MSKKRLVSMVSGTVLSALAIGFFMQRGETAAPRNLVLPLPSPIQQVVLKPAVPASPTVSAGGDVVTRSDTPNLVLASAVAPVMIPPSLPEPRLGAGLGAGTAIATLPGNSTLPTDPVMPRLGCNVTATATPGPKAMVDLQVSAPCFPNEQVTVHHNGMLFTQMTDDAGNLSVKVPALSQRAVFIVALADGKGTVALTNVPALADYDRVAIQWSGRAGFQIHALEFGAAYGGPGHVWSGAAPGDQKNSGFVTRLGNPDTLAPQMAEVYTFPSGTTSKSGVVALSVEAEVTQENCGRDISAQSLELRGRSSLRSRDLVMAMPDCSGLGDFLVLNNLVDDLKIAAR
jgi:hypothetical protein